MTIFNLRNTPVHDLHCGQGWTSDSEAMRVAESLLRAFHARRALCFESEATTSTGKVRQLSSAESNLIESNFEFFDDTFSS